MPERPFPPERPQCPPGAAFPPEFRERLASGKYTQWAVDLPYDTLESLLWMVGEVGLRAGLPEYAASPKEVPPESLRLSDYPRSRAALQIIAAIGVGRRMNLEEAHELFLPMIKPRAG